MAETAEKDDPRLWEKVKKRVTAGAKGGDEGEWSARKAQLAVAEYKKAGGGYVGERYLPKKARESLSDEEYARSTAKKRADTRKGRQFSAQPKDVAEKAARARKGEPTKAELMKEARRRDIPGRSKMSRSELEKALA